MTDNELNNIFKNTFGDHEAPVPAGMWQRIQPGEDKKRRVVLWWRWYTAAAVLLMAGMATWWFAGTTPATNNKATSYHSTGKKENNQQTALDSGVKSNSHAPQQADAALQPSNQSSTLQRPVSNQASKSIASANEQVSMAPAARQTTKARYAPPNHNAPNVAISVEPRMSIEKNNTAATGNYTITNNTDNNTATLSSEMDSVHTSETLANAIPVENENKPAVAGNKSPIQNVAAEQAKDEVALDTKKHNKKNRLPWHIEYVVTGAYAYKQTYDVVKERSFGMAAPIPPPQPKPALRNYGAGIRTGIPITKKLTLKTGLQYAQTRQKSGYLQQNMVDMIAVDNAGDTAFYRQFVVNNENHQSTFNSVSIPVVLSYQTGNKIKIGATAGIVVNAYSWYTGQVPNGTYTATLNAKDTYKHHTGAAAYAGITVAKKVGAIEIFAEPHLQYSLNNFTKNTVLFKQKINTYGLSVGIKTPLHK